LWTDLDDIYTKMEGGENYVPRLNLGGYEVRVINIGGNAYYTWYNLR